MNSTVSDMCLKCGGLKMKPGVVYGWGGPICHCPTETPLLSGRTSLSLKECKHKLKNGDPARKIVTKTYTQHRNSDTDPAHAALEYHNQQQWGEGLHFTTDVLAICTKCLEKRYL